MRWLYFFTLLLVAGQAPCSMTELMGVSSNPGGAAAGVVAVMTTNPTCGSCLMKCASAGAESQQSCAMGCTITMTTAASVALPAAGACSIDKLMMLQGITPDSAMKVLDTISATDPACGGCLKSVAMAAAADPSAMLTCATSDAKAALQSIIGGGSSGSGQGGSSGPLWTAACAGGQNIITLKDPSQMPSAKRAGPLDFSFSFATCRWWH